MRVFVRETEGIMASLRYRRYVWALLRLIDAFDVVDDEVIAETSVMDRLTLQVLGHFMAETDTKILRMSIRSFTDTANAGIAAGRLLLLLNEYFIWTRRFSARDIVQVEYAGLSQNER